MDTLPVGCVTTDWSRAVRSPHLVARASMRTAEDGRAADRERSEGQAIVGRAAELPKRRGEGGGHLHQVGVRVGRERYDQRSVGL
eukprot:169281-Prymnesium_polylepis.1